jgi:hypothetical protein
MSQKDFLGNTVANVRKGRKLKRKSKKSPKKSSKKSPKKLRKSPKKSRKSPKKLRKSPKKLMGGAGDCVNNKTDAGLSIDPISLTSIPLNKIVRIPTSYQDFPYEGYAKEDTDYYCFNQDTLLEWLKDHITNPFTGIPFTQREADILLETLKGPRFVMANGYRSPFSHSPFLKGNETHEKPWPEAFRRLIMGPFLAFLDSDSDSE